ncbi:MAG: LptF/LptG family permease [Isosphaeraceae bacterium]
MRILDRQRYWAFLKAYFICFTALVGLYVVIDAFSNFDEFTKRAEGAQIPRVMARYYLIHMSEFYDRLCGVISMMAAIFTVTWMQKNNELLAMLAAGISTHRVIRPVVISAIIVSSLAIANQEFIMPRLGEELQKSHDDDGTRLVRVFGRYDTNGVYIHGNDADRRAQVIRRFNATFPPELFGAIRELAADQALYIPESAAKMPLRGGWLLRGARMNQPVEGNSLKKGILIRLDNARGFPKPQGPLPELGHETYFLYSGLTFETLTRNRQWYQYANTVDLIRGLSDPANEPERLDIEVFLHTRILRPLLAVTLLCLSLPLVLGGYGRNMFINLGFSLGTSAVFYAVVFTTQYLGSHSVLSPELSAWAPLIAFGTLAVARWDAIRT